MKRRTYQRDRLGRFAGAAIGASAGAVLGSKTARKAIVPGSVKLTRTIGKRQMGVSASATYLIAGHQVHVAGSAKITRPTPTAGLKRAR